MRRSTPSLGQFFIACWPTLLASLAVGITILGDIMGGFRVRDDIDEGKDVLTPWSPMLATSCEVICNDEARGSDACDLLGGPTRDTWPTQQ